MERTHVTKNEGRELSFASGEKVRLSRSARFPLGFLEVWVTSLAGGIRYVCGTPPYNR